MVLVGILLVGLLVRLQVVTPERYVERGRSQRQVTSPLLAMRGSIVDRNGEMLAMTLPAKAVVVNPRHVVNAELEAAQLAPALGLEQAAVQRVLEQPDTGFAYVARQLDPEMAERIGALRLPGISIVDETRRVPAPDDLAMSLVGRMDAYGESAKFGLEDQYDSQLRGTDGERRAERGGDGGTIVGTEQFTATAMPGKDLTLTLDRSLQFWAESALQEQVTKVQAAGGTVVVGRPDTGEILAMASVVNTDTQVKSSQLNLAVRTYEPGSIMKVVTAAAAFEENVVQPETVFNVPSKIQVADKVINDAESHKTEDMTVNHIISHSSNVGTIKIAQLLGKDRILDYLDRFGLGKMTGLELDKEQAGMFRRDWYGSDIGSIPIGQSITSTPLQMWAVYNTIANGGTYVAPQLISKWTDAAGNVERPEVPAPVRVVSPTAAAKVSAALEQVIEEGTGKKWAIPGYTIAAKTGTSYQPLGHGQGYGTGGNRHYAASFAGFFPASAPEISIVVMIDDPVYGQHYGAQAAGPVFDRLAKEAMRRYSIPPDGIDAVVGPGSKPIRSKAASAPAQPTVITPTTVAVAAPVTPPAGSTPPATAATPPPATTPSDVTSARGLASAPPPDATAGPGG